MTEGAEPPPPLFRSWRRLYVAVVVNTLLVYALLLLFSAFAR
jgi:hypothetical protein